MIVMGLEGWSWCVEGTVHVVLMVARGKCAWFGGEWLWLTLLNEVVIVKYGG